MAKLQKVGCSLVLVPGSSFAGCNQCRYTVDQWQDGTQGIVVAGTADSIHMIGSGSQNRHQVEHSHVSAVVATLAAGMALAASQALGIQGAADSA